MLPGPQEIKTLGYLRKLGEKKYRIIYDLTPIGSKRKQRTETLVGITKQQAEAILAKRKNEVSFGELALASELRMNDVFDRFSHVKSHRLAPSTLQRYEGLLKAYLRPAFGTMSVSSIKAADLVATYAHWSKKKIGARTVRHAADLMRKVLNRAVKWNVIPRNPALSLDADDLPRLRKPASAVLTEVELRRLLEEAKRPTQRSRKRRYLSAYPAFYPAVAFAAFTGARRGETLAVRWQDLDLDNGTATVARSLTDAPRGHLSFKDPKNGKRPTICRSSPSCARTGRRMRRSDLPWWRISRRRPRVRATRRPSDSALELRAGFWGLGEPREGHADHVARPARHACIAFGEGRRADRGRQPAPGSQYDLDYGRSHITVYRDRDLAAAMAFDRLVS
jgi:integrase